MDWRHEDTSELCKRTTELQQLMNTNGIKRPGLRNLVSWIYEGWNFNSGNYLFTTDTK